MAIGLKFQRDCTICVAKTKALISFAVTAKLICVFIFAFAKSRFSHNEAHIINVGLNFVTLLCTKFTVMFIASCAVLHSKEQDCILRPTYFNSCSYPEEEI